MKSDDWIKGYEEAERQFYLNCDFQGPEQDAPGYTNPFPEGSEQHDGFEAGYYDFTQK